MFPRCDKRRIYELMKMYLDGEINEKDFCDDFVITFDQELDYDTLTEAEFEIFSELGDMASRFSDVEQDLIAYPGVYCKKSEIKEKIIKAGRVLKKNRLIL